MVKCKTEFTVYDAPLILPFPAPELQFTASSYTVFENVSTVSVCLRLNRVSYATIGISVSTAESSPPNATGKLTIVCFS